MKTFTHITTSLTCLVLLSFGCAAVTDGGGTLPEETDVDESMGDGDGDEVTGSGGAPITPMNSGGAPTEPGPAGGSSSGGTTPVTPPKGPAKSCVSSGNVDDVLLFDDFEDGAATWFTNQEIFWSLTQDESQAYEQAYAADELVVAAGGCSDWANVLVEARVKMTAGTDSDDIVAVMVRLTDASNFYYVAFQGDGKLKLKSRVDGSNSSIGTTYGDTILEKNVWYTLGIEAVGPQLNMYLDGVLVDRVDEPGKFSAVDTDLTSGLAGFGTLGNATALFDDVTVTQR